MGTFIAETTIVIVTIFTYLIFVLPGFIFFKTIKLSNVKALIYGAPLGFAITSLLIMIAVAINGWNLLYLSFLYSVLLFLMAFLAYKIAHDNRYNFLTDDRHSEKTSHIPLFIFLIVTSYLILVFIPLVNVGKITEYGYAFTGLFSHDFILRGQSSIALAKDIPPDNYHFGGLKIYNYYMLGYVLPATVYNLIHTEGNIRDIISIICLLNVPFFYLFIYYTVIDFMKANNTASEGRFNLNKVVLIFIFILFCYSYHWMFFILKQIVEALGLVNINHFTKQMSLLSQSWFRDIIFEPQLTLSIMMILLILKFMSSKPSVLRGIFIGIVLSSVALTDTVLFFIFGTAYFIYNVIKIIINRNLTLLADISVTILWGLIIAGVMFLLKIFIVPEYSNEIIIKTYIPVIVGLPVFLILHYGAIPITALLGIKKRTYDESKIFMMIMILVSVLFMLFITETLEGNVFLRKSLYLFRLPLILFTGYYLYHAIPTKSFKILIVLLVLAFPTVLTDVYAISNVTNKRYTTYIKPDEMEAALWIKKNTQRNSVVQSRIDYPGYFSYSLTTCFGERRAALGHWKIAYVTYPNKIALKERVNKINKIFLSDNNKARYNILKNLNIDYVFIGNREREYYPQCEMRFNDDKMHFEKVFSNSEVRIYKVLLHISDKK